MTQSGPKKRTPRNTFSCGTTITVSQQCLNNNFGVHLQRDHMLLIGLLFIVSTTETRMEKTTMVVSFIFIYYLSSLSKAKGGGC